jgi:hypothetical protein
MGVFGTTNQQARTVLAGDGLCACAVLSQVDAYAAREIEA